MPRINTLKIHKLGNAAPGTELMFGSKGAVFLGRNGTGKTTILNLLVNIGRCDLKSISTEDYDIEFTMSCASGISLQVTVKCEEAPATHSPPEQRRDPATSAMRTVLQERPRQRTLRIEAIQTKTGERSLIESNDIETTYTDPDGHHSTFSMPLSGGWRVLEAIPMDVDFFDTYAELVTLSRNLYRFDEGLDYFRSLTEEGEGSASIEAFKEAGRYWASALGSRAISPRCAQLLVDDFNEHEESQPFGLAPSTSLEYLQSFCDLADFQAASLLASLDEKRSVGNQEVVNLTPLRFWANRNGSSIHHRHLSFGQKRLLAFLHYHDSTPSLIIADELVNGMHHEWISQCVRIMQDSQAFLSSQNPLLFDFLSFESAEDVAQRFIICDLDDQHRFVWRNMNDSDALEFYETHKAGLQHASEILRTRGYW